jgi:uncharacterized protein (TIGR03792 family)
MVIEQLSFRVPLADQPGFLSQDAAIWTPMLAAQPGFIGKEVWREAEAPEMLHLIIRWENRAAWKAVDPGLLADTDRRFAAALGATYPVLRCLDQNRL